MSSTFDCPPTSDKPCSCKGPGENLSCVLYGINDIRMENRPKPEPKENEVLINVNWVGICHTDLAFIEKGRMGKQKLTSPTVFGHESMGVVEKVGRCVRTLVPGDRVAIEPGVACLACGTCKDGNFNLCPNMKYAGIPPDDGMMSRYKCHPAAFCHKIPDNVDCPLGALVEPLAATIHASEKANINIKDIVLVLGCSTFGLCAIQVALARGAQQVCAIDTLDKRLTIAKQLGATTTINIASTKGKICDQIQQALGCLPNKTVDCKASEATLHLAVEITRPGGIVVVCGLSCPEAGIPIITATMNEITIMGSFRYHNDFPVALYLMGAGKVNLAPLVTHKYRIDNICEAIEAAKKSNEGTIKVLVNVEAPEFAPKDGWSM